MQTMASLCQFHQAILDQVGLPDQRIHASALDVAFSRAPQFSGNAASLQLVGFFIPNIARAISTAAWYQTQLDQFRVACALERYRLANGQYPESCDALVPAYLEAVPNDLFAGKPLQYRRNQHGDYQIWSIGWDEKDDGGAFKLDVNGKPMRDDKNGDWVWLQRAK